jgi:hypothetical protein
MKIEELINKLQDLKTRGVEYIDIEDSLTYRYEIVDIEFVETNEPIKNGTIILECL